MVGRSAQAPPPWFHDEVADNESVDDPERIGGRKQWSADKWNKAISGACRPNSNINNKLNQPV